MRNKIAFHRTPEFNYSFNILPWLWFFFAGSSNVSEPVVCSKRTSVDSARTRILRNMIFQMPSKCRLKINFV